MPKIPTTAAQAPAPNRPVRATAAPLTTAAVCREAGVTRGLLRLYETEGLLAPPLRSAAGYRHYDGDTVARLRAIRQLKEVGFSLREIATLLAENDVQQMGPARLRALAQEQVQRIDERIARLQVVREYVAAVARGDFTALDDPGCSFLMRFLGASAPRSVTPSTGKRRRAPLAT